MKGTSSRRVLTVAVTVLVLLVLVVVGTTVQVPFVALGPGPTVNTLGNIELDNRELPVVDISGAPTQHTDGHLNLTTVSVTDGLSLFQAIGMWMSGTYSVQPRETVFPPNQSTEETQQQNVEDMSNSESTAQAAALRYLNRPTELVAELVAKDGPAASVLKSGDVIVRVGGTAVATSEDLQKVVRAHKPGDEIPFEIRRDGITRMVAIKAAARPGERSVAYIGVTPEVRNADPNLKITFNVGDIGGPSAGLMLTLAVIDRLGTTQLTHGKFIAGTGTIADDGEVGPIGGITHKTRAARDAGATVFLVPDQNCTEAASDAPDGLTLVKVESLTSALDALGAIGAGKPAPHC
ncbi:YlbL family protein [Gordonia sp. DT30]|uniref:YlbL family protein n=1 Tax=unclassified Gordonia (in: high G+C Gram-positive bacteria) TaxID=2657482 RepID=UPI003CEA97F0